jgi:hypothetical protein
MNILNYAPVETPAPEPAAEPPQPFTLWRPSQFIAWVAPTDAAILGDNLLESGKWLSIVGIGGLGKTRLALRLAIAQILCCRWCGLQTFAPPRKWIIISSENGIRRWKDELGKMLDRLTPEQTALVDAHILILAMTDDEDGELNAGSPESMARLRVTLETEKPGALILDPWADVVAGDENKTADVILTLRILRAAVRRCAPTAAVVIVHHGRTGAANVAQAGDAYNAGNFGRGGKALYSAVRAEIQLAPGDRDDDRRLVLACGKNSDGPKFATRGIVFDPELMDYTVDPDFDVDAWRNDVNGQRGEKDVSVADVVSTVKELCPTQGQSAKRAEIMQALDGKGSESTMKRRLNTAVKLGYLRAGEVKGSYRLGHKPLPR